jgi:DNA-binding transcriptional MerR regulator
MTKTFRIKELTSVSIRTLHYYHEIELLIPSYKTPGGHRLYSEDDIARLQQITALKFLGFTLEQIIQIIGAPNMDLKKSLKIQLNMMNEKSSRILKAVNLLQNLVNQLDVDDSVDWETVIKIIEVMQMNETNNQVWLEKYLTQSELSEFEEMTKRYSDDFWNMYNRKWAELYKEVEENLQTDPESETGMMLAKKWLDLVDQIYPRNSKVRKKLWEACKAEVYPQEYMPKPEIIRYIAKATEKFKHEQNKLNY